MVDPAPSNTQNLDKMSKLFDALSRLTSSEKKGNKISNRDHKSVIKDDERDGDAEFEQAIKLFATIFGQTLKIGIYDTDKKEEVGVKDKKEQVKVTELEDNNKSFNKVEAPKINLESPQLKSNILLNSLGSSISDLIRSISNANDIKQRTVSTGAVSPSVGNIIRSYANNKLNNVKEVAISKITKGLEPITRSLPLNTVNTLPQQENKITTVKSSNIKDVLGSMLQSILPKNPAIPTSINTPKRVNAILSPSEKLRYAHIAEVFGQTLQVGKWDQPEAAALEDLTPDKSKAVPSLCCCDKKDECCNKTNKELDKIGAKIGTGNKILDTILSVGKAAAVATAAVGMVAAAGVNKAVEAIGTSVSKDSSKAQTVPSIIPRVLPTPAVEPLKAPTVEPSKPLTTPAVEPAKTPVETPKRILVTAGGEGEGKLAGLGTSEFTPTGVPEVSISGGGGRGPSASSGGGTGGSGVNLPSGSKVSGAISTLPKNQWVEYQNLLRKSKIAPDQFTNKDISRVSELKKVFESQGVLDNTGQPIIDKTPKNLNPLEFETIKSKGIPELKPITPETTPKLTPSGTPKLAPKGGFWSDVREGSKEGVKDVGRIAGKGWEYTKIAGKASGKAIARPIETSKAVYVAGKDLIADGFYKGLEKSIDAAKSLKDRRALNFAKTALKSLKQYGIKGVVEDVKNFIKSAPETIEAAAGGVKGVTRMLASNAIVATAIEGVVKGIKVRGLVNDFRDKKITKAEMQEQAGSEIIQGIGSIGGSAIGGTLGAIAGSVIPVVGTFIGGALGAYIGSKDGATVMEWTRTLLPNKMTKGIGAFFTHTDVEADVNTPNTSSVERKGVPVMSNDTISFIKKYEGFEPKAKWDYKQWSIGYGTVAKPNEGPITPEEGLSRLEKEVEPHRQAVIAAASKYGINLSPAQITGLTSAAFNLGDTPIIDLINKNNGDMSKVAIDLQQYNKAGGVVKSGLIERRSAESQLIGSGVTPAGIPTVNDKPFTEKDIPKISNAAPQITPTEELPPAEGPVSQDFIVRGNKRYDFSNKDTILGMKTGGAIDLLFKQAGDIIKAPKQHIEDTGKRVADILKSIPRNVTSTASDILKRLDEDVSNLYNKPSTVIKAIPSIAPTPAKPIIQDTVSPTLQSTININNSLKSQQKEVPAIEQNNIIPETAPNDMSGLLQQATRNATAIAPTTDKADDSNSIYTQKLATSTQDYHNFSKAATRQQLDQQGKMIELLMQLVKKPVNGKPTSFTKGGYDAATNPDVGGFRDAFSQQTTIV